MSKEREALKLAHEALKAMQMYAAAEKKGLRICDEAIIAAEEALAQPEQEPVAWFSPLGNLYKTRFHATANGEQVITPLYTTPQRTWVGLDHHDKKKFSSWLDHKTDDEVFTAIEAKLKELNT